MKEKFIYAQPNSQHNQYSKLMELAVMKPVIAKYIISTKNKIIQEIQIKKSTSCGLKKNHSNGIINWTIFILTMHKTAALNILSS